MQGEWADWFPANFLFWRSEQVVRRGGTAFAAAAAVTNLGLRALADTYGLERSQQLAFKLFTEDLFEHIRDSLMELIVPSLRLTSVWHARETFSEFCSSSRKQRVLVCGGENKPVFALAVGAALRRLLLDALLGIPASREAKEQPIAATEARVLDQILIAAVTQALQRASAAAVEKAGPLKVIATYEAEDRAITETLPATEPLLVAAARLSLNGREAVMALGLPQTWASHLGAKPSVAALRETAGGKEQARTSLADALVTLEAVLGKIELPLRKVRALAPGSVILLGRMEHGAPVITLRAAGQMLFSGTIVADRAWYRLLVQAQEKSRGQSEHRTAA